jgi:hypothetical protein
MRVNFREIIHYDSLYNVTSRCDSFTVVNVPYAPEPLGTATNVALSDDQLSAAFPIGFTFNFYCNNYTNFYISSNGFISFDPAAGAGCCSGQLVPNLLSPNNVIAFCWTDLNPGGVATAINYFTTGTAPSRKLVVNYNSVPFFGGAGNVTGQIVLREDSGDITIYTTSVPTSTRTITQGIENFNGTKGLAAPGRNASTWNATNSGRRFTPYNVRSTPLPLHYTWTPSTGLSSDTVQNPTAHVTTSTTYYGTVTNGACLIHDTVTIRITPPVYDTLRTSICFGDTLYIGSHRYGTAGTYRDTLDRRGSVCDSFLTTYLTVRPISTHSRNLTACLGSGTRLGGIIRTVSGIYYDTLISYNGCDSILSTNLTVIPWGWDTLRPVICADDSFRILRSVYRSSGTYYDTTVNFRGCDSVIVTVLTVNPIVRTTLRPILCIRDSIRVGHHTYGTSGTYWDTLSAATTCDSIVNTILTVLPLNTTIIDTHICALDTFRIAGFRHFNTGTYYDTVTTAAGCDSILRVNLTVRPWSFYTQNPIICQGDSFRFASHTYRATGRYFDTLIAYNGCDSVVTTNLLVNPISTITINAMICPGDVYSVHGRNYTIAGTYYDTASNYLGCDSILTIVLGIYPLHPVTINPIICLGSVIHVGISTYSATGVYYDTIADIHGCDSVVTTRLTVIPQDHITLNPSICEGRSFNVGVHRYNVAGTYLDTLRNVYGCDSFITTNLTIIPTLYYTQNPVLCGGQTIRVGTHIYDNSGRYADTVVSSLGCDSIITTNLTVNWAALPVFDTTFCDGHPYGGMVYHADTSIYDTTVSSIGCDSIIRQMRVHIKPNPALVAGTDTFLCPGFGARLMAQGGSGTYLWTPPFDLSCTICPFPVATPTSTTLYTVSSTDCDVFPLTQQVLVTVGTSPAINILTLDTTILLGQQMWLEAAADTHYHIYWHIGDRNLCYNCPKFLYGPYISGFYYAVVTDTNGCINSDSVHIAVSSICGDTTIDMPNIITPNGDGMNDEWYLKNPRNIPIVVIRIFDRWGELIFEAKNPDAKWDGLYQGQPLNSGVYTFMVKGGCPVSGEWERTGNITLIR